MPDNIIAIGDIHGEFNLLKELIFKLRTKYNLNDYKIIFLGDYIDRGEKSFEVVDYLARFKREYNCVFLRGNHEHMMFNCLDKISWEDEWLYFHTRTGGLKTIDSYKENNSVLKWDSMPESHVKFFKSLEWFYQTDDYFFVHAGINPYFEDDSTAYIWIREPFINSDKDFGKLVIFGHTIHEDPVVQDNKIGIDTGAFYHGRLTSIVLPEKKFIQVEKGDE